MDDKFKNILDDLDAALKGRTPSIDHLYSFTAQHYLGLPGKVYANPSFILHLYEPAPEVMTDTYPCRTVIHSHEYGPCYTPRFCFELGFDPSVLPIKVRRNFLNANREYFQGADRGLDSSSGSNISPPVNLSLDLSGGLGNATKD